MIARPGAARRSDRRRGAASLIEVVTSFSIAAVLFATAAVTMTLLFRLDALGRDELAATIAEGRLALDLRADVRGATGATLDGDRLTLERPGAVAIVYRPEGDALVREARDPDRVERYRLLPGTSSRWELPGEGGGRRVALELDAPTVPEAEGGGRRVVRVEATIGRDLRYAGGGS